MLLVLIILSVFGATTGAIGHALFDWPPLAGTLLLLVFISAARGHRAGRGGLPFKYVSVLLYATYAIFLALSLAKFGSQILSTFNRSTLGAGWLAGGITTWVQSGGSCRFFQRGTLTRPPGRGHCRNHRRPARHVAGIVLFLSMIAWYPMSAAARCRPIFSS